eukprot:Hpha_TRINITY_DN18759_c0_g1::TRINITY_DN18759_c0_g1_i1::g.47391::m.47391
MAWHNVQVGQHVPKKVQLRRPTGVHAPSAHTTMSDGKWVPAPPPSTATAARRLRKVGQRRAKIASAPDTRGLPRYRSSFSFASKEKAWRVTPNFGPGIPLPISSPRSFTSGTDSPTSRRSSPDFAANAAAEAAELARAVATLRSGGAIRGVAVRPPPIPRLHFTQPPRSAGDVPRVSRSDLDPDAPLVSVVSSPRSVVDNACAEAARARASELIRLWAPEGEGRRPVSARVPSVPCSLPSARPHTARVTTGHLSEEVSGSFATVPAGDIQADIPPGSEGGPLTVIWQPLPAAIGSTPPWPAATPSQTVVSPPGSMQLPQQQRRVSVNEPSPELSPPVRTSQCRARRVSGAVSSGWGGEKEPTTPGMCRMISSGMSFQQVRGALPAGVDVDSAGKVDLSCSFRTLRGKQLQSLLSATKSELLSGGVPDAVLNLSTPVAKHTPDAFDGIDIVKESERGTTPRLRGTPSGRRPTPPPGTAANFAADYAQGAHAEQVTAAAARLPQCAAAAHSRYPTRFMVRAGEDDAVREAQARAARRQTRRISRTVPEELERRRSRRLSMKARNEV